MNEKDSIQTFSIFKETTKSATRANLSIGKRSSNLSSISGLFDSDSDEELDEQLNKIRPNFKVAKPAPPTPTLDDDSSLKGNNDRRNSTLSDLLNSDEEEEEYPEEHSNEDKYLNDYHEENQSGYDTNIDGDVLDEISLDRLSNPSPVFSKDTKSSLYYNYSRISSILEPIIPKTRHNKKNKTRKQSNTLNKSNKTNRKPERFEKVSKTLSHDSVPHPSQKRNKRQNNDRKNSRRRHQKTPKNTLKQHNDHMELYLSSKLRKTDADSVTLTLGRKKVFKALTFNEKLWYRFVTFFVHDSSRFFVLLSYLSAAGAIFGLNYLQYSNNQGVYDIFGPFLGIAKGAAAVIKFNSSILLFTMCRTLLTKLRTSVLANLIPFDRSTEFHKLVGVLTILFSILHVVAHVFNYLFIYGNLNISPNFLLTGTIPGITGLVLNVVFFLAGTASVKSVRQSHFELFYYSHWLWLVFYLVTIPHGMTCFVGKTLGQTGGCLPGGEFWIWAVAGIFVYFVERVVMRVLKRGQASFVIVSVIKRPSNVLELTLEIPPHLGGKEMAFNSIAGQFIFLNCPSISRFQYHPFTLSSAPSEGVFTVNIRCEGTWTLALAKECGVDFETNKDAKKVKLPKLYVDGPFGTSSTDVFDYKVCLLVGAGIGISPFASILKELYIRKLENRAKFEKIYIFWICRDPHSFEWFIEILKDIQNCTEIESYVYLTGNLEVDQIKELALDCDNKMKKDALTGLKTKTNYGKPHWTTIFDELTDAHPATDIGVFTCAPPLLCSELKQLSVAYTMKNTRGTVIHFHKENF